MHTQKYSDLIQKGGKAVAALQPKRTTQEERIHAQEILLEN